MNKTFSDKLIEILCEVAYGRTIPSASSSIPELVKVSPQYAHKAIMELVNSIVPEKTTWEFRTDEDDEARADGYDACREEILKRLEATNNPTN